MRYVLFLGCTIPARARQYEVSARRVCARLGMELEDDPELACCGFPLKAVDARKALLLSARNLALAGRRELGLLTLCSSCASSLTEAGRELEDDADARAWVNRQLSPLGLEYMGPVPVLHIVHALHRNVGLDRVGRDVTHTLGSLRMASHHGCHFLKPSALYGFDNVENPDSLDSLIRLTGAEPIDYPGKTRCCGGPVMAYDPETAVHAARRKLADLADLRPDALTLACPFCSVMYETNQKGMADSQGEPVNIPVLFITQVLGLAMGMGPKELELKQHVIKPNALLTKLGLK